ncbi:hypothetical protein NQZ68_015177 [Dissostichus eleginoides]|nr:hypothetical protein NQZ68_015177 [Dissostichus eleginoides]
MLVEECHLICSAVITGGGGSCCAPVLMLKFTLHQSVMSALKWNRALQQLHLTNNLLNSYQDALHLGDLLRYNTTLHTLELSSNAVADDGGVLICLEELCDGLRWQTAGVRVLLLRNNQITARGMVHLAKALKLLATRWMWRCLCVPQLSEEKGGTLSSVRRSLGLSGAFLASFPPPRSLAPQSSDQRSLTRVARRGGHEEWVPLLRVLQVLDLGENLLGNEGMQVIREPLMNCSLLQLGLAQASITCEGAVALAEFLAESRQIQRLDLRHNELKVGGLMALCLALRINSSLEGLDLDHHPPQEQQQHDRALLWRVGHLRLIVDGCTMHPSPEAGNLGLTLDSTLSFNSHIQFQRRSPPHPPSGLPPP